MLLKLFKYPLHVPEGVYEYSCKFSIMAVLCTQVITFMNSKSKYFPVPVVTQLNFECDFLFYFTANKT